MTFRWKCIAAIAVIGVSAGLALPGPRSRAFGGRFDMIESLQNPSLVRDWSENGLLLSDGRQVSIPGIIKLPITSEALTQSIKNGVEITSDNRVIGLVRVHHWCGNDYVRTHLARVDLAYMLMYLKEGDYDPLPDELAVGRSDRGDGAFSEQGWNVSEYFPFERWTRRLADHGP
jgi:hypothetical protein